ncbi:Pentatricopeptide repeat [Arabidopsis thaliana x Arabidopsis arenosa]|uniref:Pentatricopeptide repeat n=1 Tax=Arabidopsis thaliana x Arabidopsis arenosa TaxID=1240361 RepID=A0A8T2ACJ2_9BRAS|nr:Pentatricopeptide repeat [Arabidopsis thaliana x Arabidopsis arenosa]
MSLRRIILGLSKSSPFSSRNLCSAAVRRDRLSEEIKRANLRRRSNSHKTCLLLSNPPYPIPKNREPLRPEHNKSNQHYGESYLHSTVTFLIHNLADLDTAMEYARLTAFTKTRGATTTATCDLIIAALCEAKRYRDAYDLFHYFFNESNIKLSVRCCNHVVKALCDDGRAHEALQLHHHMRSDGNASSCLDYQTYRILTKCLCDAGKIDEALDLVKDVFSLRFAKPEDYDIVVSHFLDHQQDFDKSWALCCAANLGMTELNNGNNSYPTVTVTAVTVTLIEHCFSRRQEETAMEFYTDLLAKRPVIEDASIKPLLEVLYKYGKTTEAWSLFHNMFEFPSGVDEDSDHSEPINAMINELFKLGMSKEAFDSFLKVRSKQRFFMNRFTHVPYANIITRCCEDGNLLSKADMIFRELLKDNPSACKISTFEEMINAYLKAGRLHDALKTANKMLDANLSQVSSLLKS